MRWKTPTKEQAAAPSPLGRNVLRIGGAIVGALAVTVGLVVVAGESARRDLHLASANDVDERLTDDQAAALKRFVGLALDESFHFSLRNVPTWCAADLPKCPQLLTNNETSQLRDAALVYRIPANYPAVPGLGLSGKGYAAAHKLNLL